MADYKELLRRAITALPENNGAARRAVYEKARSALVGQLRAIDPPLPAREITQHRLQLEDCIRQVEQEASEAVITLGREGTSSVRPAAPPPAAVQTPAPPAVQPVEAAPQPSPKKVEPEASKPDEVAEPVEEPAKEETPSSIEDIISQAEAASEPKPEEAEEEKAAAAEPEPKADIPVSKPERPIPTIVSRVEVAKSGPTSPLPTVGPRPVSTPSRSPIFEPRREAIPPAANIGGEAVRTSRLEPSIGGQAVMRQHVAEPLTVVENVPVEAALSTVREVEVEPVVANAKAPDTREAEGAIERAIETLDREARGETTPPVPEAEESIERPLFAGSKDKDASETDSDVGDTSFSAGTTGRRSGAGLTIFLVVFALLLAGVGGAGFWAWREGYVDLDQMFGQGDAVTETAEATPPVVANTQTLDTTETLAPIQPSGPGNTATATTPEPTTALEGLEEDRLEPTPEPVVPDGSETVLPEPGQGEIKSEERLPGSDPAMAAADDPASSVDPSVLAGSQSLLLEASDDGRTGAVPFSGTIEWSEGTDEIGLPTLIGHANIPARNLGVDLTIRKNSDPSLPASHLMEIDFDVSDSFVGGSIAGLPGVLLKNEELVQGAPLVGASARVVGSSFLFALSASDADAPANVELLSKRKWMDLAVIYGTGKRAIITLEKDDEAQALFEKVFAAWSQSASN